MSDNKNKKSPSAQDLLTRLKKKPEDKPAAEKKSSTYKDFLEKRNKNKEADTIGAVTADVKDAAKRPLDFASTACFEGHYRF